MQKITDNIAKITILLLNIAIIAYLSFVSLTSGIDALYENRLFLGYLICATLTLPFFISRVIFKSALAGLTAALCFLYFPLEFLLLHAITMVSGLSADTILPLGVVFNIVLWNVLLFFMAYPGSATSSTPHSRQNPATDLLLGMIPAALFSLFIAVFVRQQDSVVALDYLQHLTVPNAMMHDGALCLLPGQCANLFLKQGYTTFYHVILGNLAVFLPNDPAKTFFMLDLVYPLVASIPLYSLFKRITRKVFWSQLGVLLSLLVFVTGGFDFAFFIPQTLALLLFITIFCEEKMNLGKLAITTLLLIPIHFIFGTLFAFYLWLKHYIVDHIKTKGETRVYIIILLSFVAFTLLTNITGFSIEKTLQLEDVRAIGGITNLAFPDNIVAYLGSLGAGWIYVVISLLGISLYTVRSRKALSALTFLVLGLGFFFLAPTYANKFALGLGVFSSILIIAYLSTLNLKIMGKLLISLSLIAIFGINFYIQYNRYVAFYTQENGTTSVFVEEDSAIVDYLNKHDEETFIVSDPYTQLVIAALTRTETPNAQYMPLETRANVQQYLTDPNPANYETLRKSPGIPNGTDFDILYTSRLYRSLLYEDTSWLYNMYSLNINNSEKVNILDDSIIEDMSEMGKHPIWISPNFVLFTSQQ